MGARAEVGRLFMRLLIVTWTKMVAVCRGGDVSLTSLFRYKGLLKLLVLQQIILEQNSSLLKIAGAFPERS